MISKWNSRDFNSTNSIIHTMPCHVSYGAVILYPEEGRLSWKQTFFLIYVKENSVIYHIKNWERVLNIKWKSNLFLCEKVSKLVPNSFDVFSISNLLIPNQCHLKLVLNWIPMLPFWAPEKGGEMYPLRSQKQTFFSG